MAKHAGSSKGWGGARPGAGRPKGSVNKRNRETQAAMREEMEKDGEALDLATMLFRVANKFYKEGQYELAADVASKGAAYFHPKLASQDIEALVEKEDLSVIVNLQGEADNDDEEKPKAKKKPA